MLTVSAIDLHYGAAQALRRVSLEARPGEVTCVLGRNGVGKTSLMRAIVGREPVSAAPSGSATPGSTAEARGPRAARRRLRAAGA